MSILMLLFAILQWIVLTISEGIVIIFVIIMFAIDMMIGKFINRK